jgi:glutathionyl-hydroquinone reductase
MGNYPALWRFVQRMYALPGVADTVEIEGIKMTYYYSRPLHNKMGITVPPTPDGFDDALAAARL